MRNSLKTRHQYSSCEPIADFWRKGERIETHDAGWTYTIGQFRASLDSADLGVPADRLEHVVR